MKSDKTTNPETLHRLVENSERAAAELHARLTLGLASKRKAESWEEFEERVIQMFRDKGFFKNNTNHAD